MSTSRWGLFLVTGLVCLGACSGSTKGISGNPQRESGGPAGDGGSDGPGKWAPQVDASLAVADLPQYNGDAFFASDPPPRYCGPAGGGEPPALPGGTPDCPDDKNREGCACPKAGATAACWPGLRANRNRGICADGVTTCQKHGELQLRWGPCEGYTLPTPGVSKGPESCGCFSAGRWELTNLQVCFVTLPSGVSYALSPYLDGAGNPKCPTGTAANPPEPNTTLPWSPNSLTVDCAGQFKLCYAVKAGDAKNPLPSDCVLVQTCTEGWYGQRDVPQAFPPLPAWKATGAACVRAFMQTGGYGEMTVEGTSAECEAIDDGGQPFVFNRIAYCPLKCSQSPNLPECAICGHTGDGNF